MEISNFVLISLESPGFSQISHGHFLGITTPSRHQSNRKIPSNAVQPISGNAVASKINISLRTDCLCRVLTWVATKSGAEI